MRFEDTSSGSTIVEVRAPDGPGILHRVSQALGKAGLDIRTAIVSTIGADVVDSFYVGHGSTGSLPQGELREAVREAVLQALGETKS